MTTTQGTFLVTEADDASAVLRDVEDGQVHTLSENPDLEAGHVVDATLTAEPPMEVTWRVDDLVDRREIDVAAVDLAPTGQVEDAAADQPTGELTRIERAGEGEIHVLTVPEDRVEEAVDDVLEDEATIERAARLGAVRVEVRTGDEFVSVRYLPK